MTLEKYGGVFESSNIKEKIEELEKQTSQADFWTKAENPDKIFKELTALKESYYPWQKLIRAIDDINEIIDLYDAEETLEDEESIISELNSQILELEKTYNPLRLKTLLNDKYDKNDCYLTVHSGSGGTEASDWANMLLRLYLRWCEQKGFKTKIIDILEDQGGIKSATIEVKGDYAFGYLKSEAGVHRLVRISPFDSQKRRHTSFGSVYTTPVIEDDIEIELKSEDYRLDTYRAGGAGGQHVNKTDSAVRITHYESGIVVQCQNERSQLMNKEVAFKMLRSKLYEYYEEKRKKEHEENAIKKKEISWGSQIRSYVFQPYTMVKDHRTNAQSTNVNAVMDGDIDVFIEAYLQWIQEE